MVPLDDVKAAEEQCNPHRVDKVDDLGCEHGLWLMEQECFCQLWVMARHRFASTVLTSEWVVIS